MKIEPERSIRVFISSTFVDNQAERDLLVKKIFPQLRKICEERNVAWSEVDLRWGITEDKIKEGSLIPIIIEEIKRCRPYFIGILGNRYGYVPTYSDFTNEVLSRYPWISDYQGRSITELEIIYGAFNQNINDAPAFFYLRMDANESKDSLTEENHDKLTALKKKIREGSLTWHEYHGPEEMGEMVLTDFRNYLDATFPEDDVPDGYTRENILQEAYIRNRGGIYIGGDRYYAAIRRFLDSECCLLVVEGKSGSGKTSLLSNWCLEQRQEQDNPVIFSHFIGSTANSTNWRQMLSRLLYNISDHIGLHTEIPTEPDDLRASFKRMLANVNSKALNGRITIVIDALNQLEDREGARELIWLPEMVNENIRFILSSLPGTSLTRLMHMEHRTLIVEPLSSDEQKELINRYLERYSKSLDGKYIKRITKSKSASNPLYLTTLLNELRLFGRYEELGDRVNYYLSASNPLELFEKVLARLEEDFASGSHNLVVKTFCSVYVSRRGLEEAELLEILSQKEGGRLPTYYWSPFYIAVENALVSQSGLINFSHDYLRQAVRQRFIPDTETERRYHDILAKYFLKRLHFPNSRLLDELPWHLAMAGRYKKLFDLLSDRKFFNLLWKNNKFDLKYYCALLEQNSRYTVDKLAIIKAEDFELYPEFCFNMSTLLYEMSKWDMVRKISKPMVKHFIALKDWNNFSKYVNIIAQMMLDGKPEETTQIMEWTRLAKKHSEKSGEKTNLMNSLLNLAYGYSDQGKNSVAIRYNNRAIGLARDLNDQEAMFTAYNNNAVIYNNKGDDDLAMDLYNRVLEIGYNTGDLGAVQLAKGNMAWVYHGWGELEKALDLFTENERFYREWGDQEGQAFAKSCQAMVYYEFNQLEKAEALYNDALEIYLHIKDYAWIPVVIGWLGIISFELGKVEGALGMLRSALIHFRKEIDYEYMPSFMAEYARILILIGRYKSAGRMLAEAEMMADSVDYKSSLLDICIVKTLYFLRLNDLVAADESNKSVKRLASRLRSPKGMIRYSIYQAEIYKLKFRNTQASESIKKAKALAMKHGYLKLLSEIENFHFPC